MFKIFALSKDFINNVCEIENESFGDPWSRQSFIEVFDNPLTICFAAFEDYKMIGYLFAYDLGPEIQILNVAVKKSERRRNVATVMLEVIFKYAENGKTEELTLEVRESNGGAIALYKKLGFQVDGIRKNYYRNPKENAVLMSLILRREDA